jgi:hypothetical protein
MGAAVVALVAASMTFSYRRRLETVSTSLTFSYNMFATVVVGASIRAIYLREDPTAEYIPCGFCATYRAIDPSFLALHMLECHELELIKAPTVSNNAIPSWYNLEQRAVCITELIQKRNLRAGWLAIRK